MTVAILPADIISNIFTFLPLSCVHQLLEEGKKSSCYLTFLSKRELLSRVKRESWTIKFYTPSAYFAILCNRDIIPSTAPLASLNCVGFCSRSEYLRFETFNENYFELSSNIDDGELEFKLVKIYCSQWINLFTEDDNRGKQIKLVWQEGDQRKQLTEDLSIHYRCILTTTSNELNPCIHCKENNRCYKHIFTNSLNKQIKKMKIQTVHVSLNWLNQGLLV
ncbi:uncharacterized protein BX663DRAFT_502437 [Cokeromyces recurvatus]|uniref:uncharacterized protein n=1 Tax=Cokeromyces recurvatus TaxID=90255 RepID=UPI00221FBFB5|nr:uncharacterized protein BX663DRAFT_502437 [Cokeromyces recurvatus]KAI7905319.1 hypothetical protein BX663DRAFT_502437 [Cokeromyces recurvatus]